MFIARDLVRLVIQLHPYTQLPAPVPTMTFAPPLPPAAAVAQDALVAGVAAPVTVAALDAAVPPNFAVFNFETQDNPAYQMDWTWMFKGQERIIRRALRFEYRY